MKDLNYDAWKAQLEQRLDKMLLRATSVLGNGPKWEVLYNVIVLQKLQKSLEGHRILWQLSLPSGWLQRAGRGGISRDGSSTIGATLMSSTGMPPGGICLPSQW